MDRFDIIVIGGGLAGASAAAELAASHKVLLLEAERQPGYHSTGRSAALFSETYGAPVVRSLSQASRPLFFNPPAQFAAAPLVGPRGVMYIASEQQMQSLREFESADHVGARVKRIEREQALQICPILRPECVAGALYETGACDIDVHGLHQAYLRMLRARGGVTVMSSRVTRLEYAAREWTAITDDARYFAPVVINAAGAWADEIASLAGVAGIELQPCRRTALLVAAPAGVEIGSWPLVLDIEEQFYFKPDAGLLLLSPADETPVEPSDVQPEEWDIAVAIDRVCSATTLDVRHVKHKWAGLRNFVADRTPVVGFDANVPGFFWLAAQGGYGVQTAPAMARLAASLVRGQGLPEDLATCGVTLEALSPDRLRRPAPLTRSSLASAQR
ncbi:NAD(P)/FAD-dependent oxidoreductase [Peristeroidobacter agariperforans]|uniref:NAD(P)/FAD-dependent oxidoreductase n=1 Tax=Peristeroidobacter agariperforans TaxID=268404 RepID=UPI00101C695A|nr:FAD-binding oxidoreductase [Peristeroidobacter agariperforans]